jgi:hypothetical protein
MPSEKNDTLILEDLIAVFMLIRIKYSKRTNFFSEAHFRAVFRGDKAAADNDNRLRNSNHRHGA